MGAHTRVSAKGQVVIPAAVRERLRWTPGTPLEVVETNGGVMLLPQRGRRDRITVEEFRRRHPPLPGPPISIEDMTRLIDEEAARRGK